MLGLSNWCHQIVHGSNMLCVCWVGRDRRETRKQLIFMGCLPWLSHQWPAHPILWSRYIFFPLKLDLPSEELIHLHGDDAAIHTHFPLVDHIFICDSLFPMRTLFSKTRTVFQCLLNSRSPVSSLWQTTWRHSKVLDNMWEVYCQGLPIYLSSIFYLIFSSICLSSIYYLSI